MKKGRFTSYEDFREVYHRFKELFLFMILLLIDIKLINQPMTKEGCNWMTLCANIPDEDIWHIRILGVQKINTQHLRNIKDYNI